MRKQFGNFISFRHALAVMHFNLNLNRETVTNDDGTTRLSVHYPKFKFIGAAMVKKVRFKQKFGMFHLEYNYT